MWAVHFAIKCNAILCTVQSLHLPHFARVLLPLLFSIRECVVSTWHYAAKLSESSAVYFWWQDNKFRPADSLLHAPCSGLSIHIYRVSSVAGGVRAISNDGVRVLPPLCAVRLR